MDKIKIQTLNIFQRLKDYLQTSDGKIQGLLQDEVISEYLKRAKKEKNDYKSRLES